MVVKNGDESHDTIRKKSQTQQIQGDAAENVHCTSKLNLAIKCTISLQHQDLQKSLIGCSTPSCWFLHFLWTIYLDEILTQFHGMLFQSIKNASFSLQTADVSLHHNLTIQGFFTTISDRGHYITNPNNAFRRANPSKLPLDLHCLIPPK